MSIVFIDGFDHYSTSDLAKKWTVLSGNTGMTVGSYGRFGSSGIRFNDSQYVAKVIPEGSMFVVAFAFKAATITARKIAAFWFNDSSGPRLELVLNSNATLSITQAGSAITGGTSTATIPGGAFVYIEWKVTLNSSASSNTNVVKVSGIEVINLPNATNTAVGGATANMVAIGAQSGGSGYTHDYDDLYVLDGSGSVNNDFVGDRRIEVILPNASAYHGDFAATGAASDYAAVNESSPDGDTSYVSSNNPGDISTFNFSSLSSTPDSIVAVQFGFVARKDDAGSRLIAPVIRVGGTDYVGGSLGCPDSYALKLATYETNPATSAAWTASDISALEAGVKLVY